MYLDIDQEFVKVASTEDVPNGSMKTVDLDGQQVVLANLDGKYYAIGAICKHEEWDLSEGTIEGEKITCAGHGAEWDLKTGKGTYVEPLSNEPVYEVKIESSDIYLKPK